MASSTSSDRLSRNKITHAFDGIAPPSASTSENLPCGVFINHRGRDVKHTLAKAIWQSLNDMGVRVFLDSAELQLGDFLPRALEDAMRGAFLHVAIFSPSYAQSPWCLAELSFMLKTGKTIIPVFYHVQPSDLRWVASGKGMYADAFSEHEKKGRYSTDKLEEWKMALHNVSFYKGPIMSDDECFSDEGRLLKNIVTRVLEVMAKVPLEVAKHPVGLTETVQDFKITALQSTQSQNNVQIVGIWGMGGSGKTTLAKEIYNQKYSCMQRASFLFDVRDASAKSEMPKKQKTLLKDLGISHVPDFDSIEKGKGILASCLSSICVLIILDDVDHIDQLDALLPTKDSLGWGSLIIVTTREKELLRCWGVSSIYEMKTLNPSHARQLFCLHAFLQPSPMHGFEELVEKFLSACDGLPLSLKVIGGLLYGESRKDYWHDLLHKISKILPSDIKNRLRVSYDALDEEEKQIFLDTACFFIGEDKKTAIAVWDGLGWNGRYSWERLVSKCLVDINENNHIKMHDHLRDLGREIATTQPPYRLWSSGQIKDIQKQEEARIQIRGMILDAPTNDAQEYCFLENTRFPGFCWCFRRQLFPHGLKVFVVRGNYLNKQIAKLSKELVWLRWSEIAHKNLPSWLPLKNLRVLELINSKNLQELWKHGGNAPVQLKKLTISCERFQRFPKSIGYLKHLKKVSVIAGKMRSLPDEFCLLISLEQLDLIYCQRLSLLPSCFGNLTCMRHLDLHGSNILNVLPVSFKQLTLLQHLNLSWCSKLTLNSDILENMTKLEYLNLSFCWQVEELPRHITNQASLKELYLRDTRVTHLPKSFTHLIDLQVLIISDCPISELDFGLGPFTSSLSNLKKIHLTNTRVSKISIPEDCCPCLLTLQLFENQHLGEIETLPITVRDIELVDSKMLKTITSIGGVLNLETLKISFSPELDVLPSFAELIFLKEFELKGRNKVEKIEGLQHCRLLEKVLISDCPELNALPSFAELTCLKEFELKGRNKVERIEGLQHCSSVKELLVTYTCWDVPGIESLEQMQKLKTLQLVAKKISAVESCIQTIQKWPEELIICAEAVPDAESLLNELAFPNLCVVDSIANKKIYYPYPTLQQKHSSNEDAIMLCLVIKCVSTFKKLIIQGDHFHRRSSVEVDEGKWILIGVFTQHSSWHTAENYYARGWPEEDCEDNEVEKGFLVMGEEERLVEAFYRLLPVIGN